MTKVGYGLNLTGHLNTWGKDTLKGGVFAGKGIDHYMGDYGGNQGLEIGSGAAQWLRRQARGVPMFRPRGASTRAYQHFWTELVAVDPGCWLLAREQQLAIMGAFNTTSNVANESHSSVVANLIWSPVPKVDLGVEYI